MNEFGLRQETHAALAAISAARQAISATAPTVTLKAEFDPVTAADTAAEDAIRRELSAWFPEIPVVGEERGGAAEAGRPNWLVDPICGTASFAAGIPLYCTNIALVEDGAVTLAAVGDGSSDADYCAERGLGAWRIQADSVAPIQASDTSRIILVDTGGAFADESMERATAFLRTVLLAGRWYVWMFATTLVYPYLAAGKVAAVVQFRTNGAVHQAAGGFIAQEAGAIVTEHDGAPWRPESPTVLAAATPALHGELQSLLRASQ